jgi:putative transposase
MPRSARLKVAGETAYYHIISRTIQQQFLMGDVEKETLVRLIKQYSKLYFIKIIGYCIMSNHFHLLIKSEPDSIYTDEAIQKRVEHFYGKSLDELNKTVDQFRTQLSDMSLYIKQVKQTFSWRYNRLHNTTGTFWSERFKSILVEDGKALETMLAYIDLNPVRAGMVEKPEEYRFSGIGYRVQTGNADGLLSFEGIDSISDDRRAEEKSVHQYLKMLYGYGDIGRDTPDFKGTAKLNRRIRYMTDGMVIGSRGFIMEAYARFAGSVILKKERQAHPIGIIPELLSIRRLIL